MHERDTTTEKEFDAVLQMTLEHVLTQRFRQSTKRRPKVTNTCTCYKTRKLFWKNIANVLKYAPKVKIVVAGIRKLNVIHFYNEIHFMSLQLVPFC